MATRDGINRSSIGNLTGGGNSGKLPNPGYNAPMTTKTGSPGSDNRGAPSRTNEKNHMGKTTATNQKANRGGR